MLDLIVYESLQRALDEAQQDLGTKRDLLLSAQTSYDEANERFNNLTAAMSSLSSVPEVQTQIQAARAAVGLK